MLHLDGETRQYGSQRLHLGVQLEQYAVRMRHPDAETPQYAAPIRRHGDELEPYGSQMRYLDAVLERNAALKSRRAARFANIVMQMPPVKADHRERRQGATN